MLVGGGEPAAGRLAAACKVLARGGEGHSQARTLYAQLRVQPHREAATWANMAALAIALGDHEGALRHAQRAAGVDPACSAAWVNGAVALWRQRRWPECEAALRRAWAQPGAGEAVVLNLATFLRAHLREEAAGEVLAEGARRVPSAWRIALAHAESARVRMLHATVRAEALRALSLLSRQVDPGLPGRSGLRPAAGADLRAALGATCAILDATGVAYHLMAGTLLAIAKDGRLFPHDKDVDLALPDVADGALQAVRAAFAADPAFRLFAATRSDGPRPTVVGLMHLPTDVGVDLMLPRREADGSIRNESGWPDQLASVLRPYAIGTLHWDGRDWPVPAPHAQYLADMYGEDWLEQSTVAAGIRYDRCYSDTMLSNPSRTAESLPRAVNLGLLRLLHALQRREWSKSVAYCAQLLAREELPGVRAVLARLQASGHDGMRFDG